MDDTVEAAAAAVHSSDGCLPSDCSLLPLAFIPEASGLQPRRGTCSWPRTLTIKLQPFFFASVGMCGPSLLLRPLPLLLPFFLQLRWRGRME